MDWLDTCQVYKSREDRILQTTLKNDKTVLELNPFPYNTPKNVQHWTLWSVNEMSKIEIEDFVCAWIADNLPGSALEWNYDENAERSINLFHVHVYIKVHDDEGEQRREQQKN